MAWEGAQRTQSGTPETAYCCNAAKHRIVSCKHNRILQIAMDGSDGSDGEWTQCLPLGQLVMASARVGVVEKVGVFGASMLGIESKLVEGLHLSCLIAPSAGNYLILIPTTGHRESKCVH